MPLEAGPHQHGLAPDSHLTSFEPRPHTLATSYTPPVGQSVAPQSHYTLHQFRKQQLSPVLSSPIDLDYKRVRRKPSFSPTDQHPPTAPSPSPIITSHHPQAHLSSHGHLLPSLLPPTPLTPTSRAAISSPSLSSTVDTLPSTPSQTPLQHEEAAFGRWWRPERAELSEPLRSKRKLSFKQAKRLPHPQDGWAGRGGSSSSGIWQIHAAIIEHPTDDENFRNFDSVRQVRGHVTSEQHSDTATQHHEIHSSPGARKERVVRFEEETGEPELNDADQQSSQDALTSSYSLSKFKFPAPPGQHWTGTFGKSCERYGIARMRANP